MEGGLLPSSQPPWKFPSEPENQVITLTQSWELFQHGLFDNVSVASRHCNPGWTQDPFTAPDDQLSVNHKRENLVVGEIAFSDFKGDIANKGPYWSFN